MATIYIGEYQKATPEQQAFMYASGYRYTDQYVISQTQQPGMRPLPAPTSYRPGVTEAELSKRVTTQREQEYRTALELQQSRQLARSSFGGTFTPSSLSMAHAPVGTDIASEIRRMPIEQEQAGLKLQYLQSPTAQWASESEFKQAVSGVERFAPAGVEFKGTIVSPQAMQPVPTPFEVGKVKYGGVIESRVQPLPSTPIDYSRTHVSELYSWPVYKGAAFVSEKLTAGLEFGISIQPMPAQVKEIQKGVGGLVTGMPEFVASGVSGWEYAAREPEVFKTGIVPAGKMFVTGLAEQAIERPYYTLGQAAGIGYGVRGLVKSSFPKTKLSETVTKPKEMYVAETGMRGIKPSEIRTFDLRSEPVKPIFPETEGTPLTRATYPYGMAYAEKIAYPKSSKFQAIGKGIKYESWGEKPISPTEYFGSITRGRFMTEGDVFGTNKIFGGRSFRKGEIDPWAGKPTMRQSAEARGETLKRTISQPKTKPVEPISGTELKYGKQSLIAVMEEPKSISKTIQVQKTSLIPTAITKTRTTTKPIALTQYRQKSQALTIPKTQQRAITLQTQKTTFKPITISRQASPQVSEFAISYPTVAIQTPKTTQKQVYITEQVFKPIQTSVSIGVPDIVKIQKPKTKSIELFPSTRKGKRKRRGFKFPELTRVATPKQIMRGFRL